MALWLRALAALAEVWSSVLSTHSGGSQEPITPVPGYPTPSSGLLWYLHAHVIHTCRCTLIQINRNVKPGN